MKLNLGCGYSKLKDYVNIDNRKEVNPDLCCDVTQGLPYSDNSVDEIRAYDFLEHVPAGRDCIDVINEIWRVLKPGGLFVSSTPDAEYGMTAFQDLTHISFWVENTWNYFTDLGHRNLYNIPANFKIKFKERRPPLEHNTRMYWWYVELIAEK